MATPCPVPDLTLLFFNPVKDIPEAAKTGTSGTGLFRSFRASAILREHFRPSDSTLCNRSAFVILCAADHPSGSACAGTTAIPPR